jgi:hypothetical protein
MTTDRQKLLELERQLPKLKEDYGQSMQAYLGLSEKRSKKEDRRAALWAWHNAGVAFFNAHDKLIADAALLKADLDSTWYTNQAETAVNVLDTVCIHYETIYGQASLEGVDAAALKPSPTSFANMQRLARQTLPKLASPLRDRFIRAKLPTHGFDTDEAVKSTGGIEPRFFVVGIASLIFALVIVAWAFALGTLTKDQRFLLQWLLPIAGAFASGSFTGSISATSNRWKYGLVVAATGGFAVWLVTFIMLRYALPQE